VSIHTATAVDEYLASLPAQKREAVEAVRAVVLKNLPAGYVETMNWGMISYEIPLSAYPNTYNKQPLMFAALAGQKNYCTLHLMCAGAPAVAKELAEEFAKAGKKLDMGKACIHFKKAEDLALEAIGRIIARVTPAKFIAVYEASRQQKT